MSTFRLGYACKDITPAESVPLRGDGSTSIRMHTKVLDPLYVTCLAFEDETGDKALIYTMDRCSLTPYALSSKLFGKLDLKLYRQKTFLLYNGKRSKRKGTIHK